MQATINHANAVEPIDPSEPYIPVRFHPGHLTHDALVALKMVAEPKDRDGDQFREWVRNCVVRELGRREANGVDVNETQLEADGWKLPWHEWTDAELAAALGASFSWLADVTSGEGTTAAFYSLHQAVVTAAATRLHELHQAILRGQRAKGKA